MQLERQNYRDRWKDRDIFHSLSHSPHGYTSWSWAGMKLEVSSLLWVSHVSAGPICCFLRPRQAAEWSSQDWNPRI